MFGMEIRVPHEESDETVARRRSRCQIARLYRFATVVLGQSEEHQPEVSDNQRTDVDREQCQRPNAGYGDDHEKPRGDAQCFAACLRPTLRLLEIRRYPTENQVRVQPQIRREKANTAHCPHILTQGFELDSRFGVLIRCQTAMVFQVLVGIGGVVDEQDIRGKISDDRVNASRTHQASMQAFVGEIQESAQHETRRDHRDESGGSVIGSACEPCHQAEGDCHTDYLRECEGIADSTSLRTICRDLD